MRIKIWNNMVNTKFKAKYTYECYRRANLIGRMYSFFLSFASASSVAVWAVWQSVPILWASIVALAQFLQIAKPYLLFLKHEKDFLELSFKYAYLSLDYERLWVKYDADRLSEEEADSEFYILRENAIQIEDAYKQAHCLRFKKLIKKAEQDVKNDLSLNFNMTGE